MNRKYLIDAGHGGYCCGQYLTRARNGQLTSGSKKSPWKKTMRDPGIFEGHFNRIIAGLICGSTNDTYHINPGPIDIRRKDRVQYINAIAKTQKVVLISIHANASTKGDWADANGFTVFHSESASDESKQLARTIERKWAAYMPEISSRGIKVANFDLIYKTACPAVLIECGFMDNYRDAELLSIGFIQNKIAETISRAIISFDNSLSE